MKIDALHTGSDLRDYWRCYDILYDTQRFFTDKFTEIYGGPDKYRLKISSGQLVVFYAREVRKVLGAIAVYPGGGDTAEIDNLHVIEEHHGIGSCLLTTAIHEIESRKYSLVHLWCKMGLPAYQFYKKFGFTDISLDEGRSRLMEKTIQHS